MKNIHLKVQLTDRFEKKPGVLHLRLDGMTVSGCLELNGIQSFLQGKLLRRDRYVASLHLNDGVQERDCDLLFLLRENGELAGSMMSWDEQWSVEGAVLPDEPEDLPLRGDAG